MQSHQGPEKSKPVFFPGSFNRTFKKVPNQQNNSSGPEMVSRGRHRRQGGQILCAHGTLSGVGLAGTYGDGPPPSPNRSCGQCGRPGRPVKHRPPSMINTYFSKLRTCFWSGVPRHTERNRQTRGLATQSTCSRQQRTSTSLPCFNRTFKKVSTEQAGSCDPMRQATGA